ncbi:MAG: T9SS type A sorting domain-containing protein, partial [Candidatus Marinimicrobia bacterium]|nr:T9SS type A sorting domain-containing protein [Candidatus Neomarinimicrobiota bacterium]
FFGTGTSPSTSTGNQLTYISTGVNKLKGRTDQHNVYIFFTYLQEKLASLGLTNAPEWGVVGEICQSSDTGVQAVDTALEIVEAPKSFADYFADYGMACYLDMASVDSVYGGIYSFESLDLTSAPSSKSASALKWDKANNEPAPYMFKNIAPWTYNWVIMQGYIVDIESNIVFKSPDLSHNDTLVFNGYDGIQFKVKKLVLKSGFLDPMSDDYEVVDFQIDSVDGYGILPVTTDSLFTFKELGPGEDLNGNGELDANEDLNGNGILDPDTSSGIQMLMLMVAKVDDAPAPPTSDFWVSNIVSLPDFSSLFGFQNPGSRNHLDIFVASQRAVYDTTGNEMALVQYITETDSGELALEILNNGIAGFTSYHTSFELSAETNYTFVFQGRDASGNDFIPDTLDVNTIFYTNASRSVLLVDQSSFVLEPGALNTNQYIAGMKYPKEMVSDLPEELSVVSEILSLGSQNKKLNRSATVNIYIPDLSPSCRVYQYFNNSWHNIGGEINNDIISANTTAMGRFVVLDGERHLPESDMLILPDHYVLFPNYPNPFNPTTTISYSLPEPAHVSIRIFDLLGRTVWSTQQTQLGPGVHSLIWSGKNMMGTSLASGIYFVEMETDNFIAHRKILLLK